MKHARVTVQLQRGWQLIVLQALALSSGFWAGVFAGISLSAAVVLVRRFW